MRHFLIHCLFVLPILTIYVTFVPAVLHAQIHTESWDSYLAKFGDQPASVLVDMGLNASAPDKRYPYLVVVGPKAHSSNKYGLPDNEEISQLETILDATDNFITGITAKVLAGTVTYNGERLNYYYVKDTTGIRNAIRRMYNRSFKDYQFKLSVKSDPQWLTYSTFLYPSEETLNWMDNNKLITVLLQSGDSLTKPRNIVYAACFKTDSSRSAFMAFVTGNGYTVQKSPTVKNYTFPECILFSRFGYIKMDSINIVTTTIKEEVKKHNGFYDGWSAPLK